MWKPKPLQALFAQCKGSRGGRKTRDERSFRYERVDEKRGMLYYIEGFVYSPDRQQREQMRELEAILHTFKAKWSRNFIGNVVATIFCI